MKQVKIFFLLFIFSLSLRGNAANNAKIVSKLNTLHFSNRARCAADSKLPADSTFLLINNIDPGKAIYRLAKYLGRDANEMTKEGIKFYRRSILELVKLIHYRLMNRELPLLPANTKKSSLHIPSRYTDIIDSCPANKYCAELDDYISDIWKISSKRSSNVSKVLKFYDVDNFHSKDNFIREKDFTRKKFTAQMNCYHLKKFGAIQGHLFGTKPGKAVLEDLSKSLLNSQNYLSSCESFDDDNLEVSNFQLEIPFLKKRKWKKKGFDYWNSLKIYLSWAFRYAPEMEAMAGPYANIFKGVSLEDSILLTPNGCKSISVPECSGDYLAQNAMREFAKKDFVKEAMKLDLMSSVPEGPQGDVLNNPAPSINIDELDLGNFPSANEWLKNYKDNFTAARTLAKRELLKALSLLSITKAKLPISKIIFDIDQEFQELKTSFSKSIGNEKKNDLYYLCSEFYFSGHDTYSFLKSKLNILKKTTLVDGLLDDISEAKTKDYYHYYEQITEKVIQGCNDLKQKNIWDDSFELDKEGYSKWYVEKVFAGKVKSKRQEKEKNYLKYHKAYLSYKSNLKDNIICSSPSACARNILKSIITLYKTAEYAETFFSLEQKVKSPQLANPYAERVACGVYDPWFKTKSMLFNLMWDVGQAALSSTVPGLIYTRAELIPKTVTSITQMVKDGKITYNPKYDKQKIITALTADFGPLLGVPCAINLNSQLNRIYDRYRFAGINVGACHSNEEYNINVYSGSEVGANQRRGHAECLSCQLNFEGVSSSIAYAAGQVGPSFFLFRGIVRLFRSLKDSNNIHRSWDVNPRYLIEAFQKYGEIPKRCVRSLRKGRRCSEEEESIWPN